MRYDEVMGARETARDASREFAHVEQKKITSNEQQEQSTGAGCRRWKGEIERKKIRAIEL